MTELILVVLIVFRFKGSNLDNKSVDFSDRLRNSRRKGTYIMIFFWGVGGRKNYFLCVFDHH